MVLRRRKGDGDSQKALDSARRALREVKARDAEVREVAQALKRERIKNHFSEKIYAIMTGHSDGWYMQ